jgi:starch phosphorylase
VRFGAVTTHSEGTQYAFEVQMFLGGLDPQVVEVELYAEPQADGKVFRQKMEPSQHIVSDGYTVYSTKVPASRPLTDYTARVISFEPHASVPLEAIEILWQK